VGGLSGYAKNPEGLGFGFFLNRTHQFFSMEFLYFDLIILLFIYLFVNFEVDVLDGNGEIRRSSISHSSFSFSFLLHMPTPPISSHSHPLTISRIREWD
jgi:hypothetical protein